MALLQNRDQLCIPCQSMPLMKEVLESHIPPWQTLQQLISSAQDGCYFCRYVYEVGIKSWMELNRDDVVKYLNASIGIYWNGGHLPGSNQDQLAIAGNHDEDLVLYFTREDVAPTETFKDGCARIGSANLSIFVTPEESISSLIQCRPVHENPVSEEAFATIQRWMNLCFIENRWHISCRSMKNPQLPRFIVQIQNGQSPSHDTLKPLSPPKLRVVENKELEQAPYIALSYPWGVKTQPVQLMKSTVAEFKESIKYESLPRAIQDAIRVSQGLGFSYIWVDVLCIVQDDAQIKKEQIRDMKNIYGNSTLTVQALNIKSVHESFLLPRNNHTHNPLKMRYDENNHIYLRGYKLGNTPSGWTTHRAWMLEEAVLPSKLLVYDRGQFSFRCENFLYREDGSKVRSVSLSKPKDWRQNIRARLKSPAPPDRRLDYLATWYGTLASYTPRLLTDSHDRLPAIDGIAQRIKSEIGGRYIAGIWESDLPWGLLWESHNFAVSNPRQQSGWPVRKLERPAEKRAPSWSWASVDGSIRHSFWARHNDMIGMETSVCAVSIGHSEADDESFAKDIDLSISAPLFHAYFQVTYRADGRYPTAGNKKSRRLTVGETKIVEDVQSFRVDQHQSQHSVAYAEFDIQKEELQYLNKRLCALVLCRSAGLIIERVQGIQGKEVYKRVGLFRVIPEFASWCLEQPRKEVRLV